jgi:hypothetical protein
MRKTQALWFSAVLWSTAGVLHASDFVAPAEGPVAFRRDQIPLDSDTIATISAQLRTLAEATNPQTSTERRGVAQMLALATALDPSNTAARELITDFQLGTHEAKADPAQVAKTWLKIWQYIDWLESPEAGSTGRALAACLADVMALSDAKNPRSIKLRESGERGAWAGWIPPVSAYETKQLATKEEPVPFDVPDPAITTPPPVKLSKAQIMTPVWQKKRGKEKEEQPEWEMVPGSIQMSAQLTPEDEDSPKHFNLVLNTGNTASPIGPAFKAIQALLKKEHGPLPAKQTVVISRPESQEGPLLPKRRELLNTAPIAVLASAAITGREPEAMIIGMVDSKGALTLPVDFWDQIHSIEQKGTGGRLVLPAAAADYLPSMLAMEKPQFFFDYEVLLAANFKEMLELSAKVPTDTISKGSSKFQEIRSKSSTQPIGQYLANGFIRRRLTELSQEAPYHFSARMLATQGAGNRPTQTPHPVLVSELRMAIAPMAWIAAKPASSAIPGVSSNSGSYGKTFEICRDQVDRLERYVQKEDRPLFDEVKELVAGVRTLDRTKKSRINVDSNGDTVYTPETVRIPFLKAYNAVQEALSGYPQEELQQE